jgi:cardiolipin synthase
MLTFDAIDLTALYYVSEWFIRVGALVYVPQRRPPAAARTWLLLIFLFPWPATVLYGVFGRIDLPKRRRQLLDDLGQRIRLAAQELPITLRCSAVPLPEDITGASGLVERLTAFPMLGGNSAELLTDYHASLERLAGDIRDARNTVHLLYYIYADDTVSSGVTQALTDAARRGVTCRLLLDGIGSKTALRRLAPRLREAGVEVVELMPVRFFRRDKTRIDLRNHRKIAVIDGRIGHLGSQNIVAPDFVPGFPNEELVVRVTGPVVAELQALFLADRLAETHQPVVHPSHFGNGELTGPVFAQLVPSSPAYRQQVTQTLLVWLIHQARHRVVITTPYFVPDEPFLAALRTAVERGVDVRLVVSKHSNQLLTNLAQKSYYTELLEAGVKVYLYRPHFLHAKHVLFDERLAFVGSSNIDIRSFALNAEASLLLHDPEIARQLHALNERHIENSDRLTAEDWARRPLLTRVSQNVARLADSLL